MRKRFLPLMMILVLLVLTGCGDDQEELSDTDMATNKPPTAAEDTAAITDEPEAPTLDVQPLEETEEPTAPVEATTATELSISTSAFSAGQPIPVVLTCDGDNSSPDLQWQGIPEGTQSLALIVDDPDAPVGIFVHWVLYNMPPTLDALPAGVSKDTQIPGIGTQGMNDFRRTGYDGPCPPRGKAHRYFFKLYALDANLNLPEGLKASALEEAMQGHILAEVELYGTYSRQ